MPPSGHSSAAASSNIGSSAPRSPIPIGSGGTPMATAAAAGDDDERRGSCGPLKRASPFRRRRSCLQIGASGSGMRMRRGWWSGGRLRPAARVTGRELRRGMWWDRGSQRFVEEGVDFIQDTEVGGSDEYEFIPASDDEDDGDVIPPDSVDQEVVPETEPQVFVAVEPEVHQVVAMEKKEGQGIDLVAKSTREDVFGEVAVKINETISYKETSPSVFDVGKEDGVPMVEEKRISEDDGGDPYADADWRGYSQEYEFDEVVFDMGRALMPGYTQIWKECAKKRKRN
ncbi:hypothetical protein ACP70R_001465 [Stipagrostis hirtigluma subsp. patula]